MAKPKDIGPEIRDLREQGKTYDEISSLLGVAKSTISYHVGNGNENTRAKANVSRNVIKRFIRSYKETNYCVDCKQYWPYVVMQFDHLPQFVKLFTIASWYEFTNDIKVVIAEMKKCDLVCGNCHSIRGHQRRLEKNLTKAKANALIDSDLD
jgi:hypothetical protein